MNKRKPPVILLIQFIFIFKVGFSTKLWIEYPDFDNPDSWQSGYLPCSQDEIVFPESYSSAILLATTIDTTGIVLPKDGALLLQPDSTIAFSSGISNSRKCENSDQVAKMKVLPSRHWFDPHNWRDISNGDSTQLQNAAVPHIERIPCNNETVTIPATGPLSIDLSDVNFLRVGQVNLAGSDVSKELMEKLFKSDIGEVMFKYASLTEVQYFNEPLCGCHQKDIFWEYEWKVCQHVQDLCERPRCLTPIVPSGHCCAICGVMINVLVDKCDQSYPGKLNEMVQRSLNEQEMQDKLIYHVSYVDGELGSYLQLIVVERDDYEESSIKFIHRFNETVDWGIFRRSTKRFFTSGRPYNPNGLGAALLLMIGTLFGVLAFFAVIFVNFVPENPIVRLPRWMHVRLYDLFQSPFVFARFDNTAAAEGDAAENLVIDVQQYNVSSEYSERTEGTSTSFDNPMFVENQPVKDASHDDDDIPLQEDELTEIDLESEAERKL